MARHVAARARARAEITEEIKAAARRQLAEHGAPGLSLRAVARELGMVSSAVYRYVASRDELLTLLIVDAYDALGEQAEKAAARSAGSRASARWVATAQAVRRWAQEHPHEYALLYGSPVPGYEAPTDTVAPAARVSLALIGIVGDAAARGAVDPPGAPVAVDDRIRADLEAIRRAADLPGPDEVVLRTLVAWSQLFGLVTFELFGQTRGLVEHHDAVFETAAAAMAAFVGLD